MAFAHHRCVYFTLHYQAHMGIAQITGDHGWAGDEPSLFGFAAKAAANWTHLHTHTILCNTQSPCAGLMHFHRALRRGMHNNPAVVFRMGNASLGFHVKVRLSADFLGIFND